MNSPVDHALALLARARDDLYVARRLADDPGAPGWAVGFHAQQAAEKALKAVMTDAGLEYPRTHNLDMLTSLLQRDRLLPSWAADIGMLTPFGVVLRYEDAAGDPMGAEVVAVQLVRLAAQVTAWAEAALRQTR